jgi:hypothetical protein
MHCSKCQAELLQTTICDSCGWMNNNSDATPESEPQPSDSEESDPVMMDNRFQAEDERLDESRSEEEAAYTKPESYPTNTQGEVINKGSTVNISDGGTQVGISQDVITNLRDIVIIAAHHEGQKSEEEMPFQQATTKLPLNLSAVPDYLANDLPTHLRELEARQLILISCPNGHFALEAAQALIARLNISSDENIRSLDIEEKVGKGADIGIQSFFPPERKPGVRTAILVNALYENAQNFLDHYFRDPARSHKLYEGLKENGVFVLTLVEPEYINEKLRDSHRNLIFPHWRIPFLQPLLKQEFPEEYIEFQQQILSQQGHGKWEMDESRLFHQVNGLIKTGHLRDAIHGEMEQADPADKIFEDEDQIQRTVLYVATYFPNLTASEFCQVVESLLDNCTTLATRYSRNDDGTDEWVQKKAAIALSEIWKELKDTAMWKRLRETSLSQESVRTIEFSNFAQREAIRTYLENKRRFYLRDQFKTLLDNGFFFHASQRIGKNMVRLAGEMAAAYPDEYNKDWLVGLLAKLKEQVQSDPNARGTTDPVFQLLKDAPGDKLNFAYSRIAELFRLLLKASFTKDAVERCLTELIGLGYHESVLILIKRLRLAPEFDVLYWTKQLLDRGEATTRVQAFNHLYNYVRRADANVYETLGNIHSWLPIEERGKQAYPQSSRFALRLLIQYCLETLNRFNPREFGAWPSTYPLFAFADIPSAERDLGRLARWLFYPGMKKALQELGSDSGMKNVIEKLKLDQNPNRLAGALIAEWTFILLGPDQPVEVVPVVATNHLHQSNDVWPDMAAGSAPAYTAGVLFNVLLRQVALIADNEQKEELIRYWRQLEKDMRKLIQSPKCALDQKQQLKWKRNRIPELIERFEGVQRQTLTSAFHSWE